MSEKIVILCPGQGAQAVGMGKAWAEKSPAARAVFDEADRVLASTLGASLSDLCFNGPAERLNQTDISQPAIYTSSVACFRGLTAANPALAPVASAGLSLGEYTALHLAGCFDFATGLRLVARRGRLMQDAAIASHGGMVALIGADDAQAQSVCDRTLTDLADPREVLVPANFNAPGQIVLSGSQRACHRAVQVASDLSLRATPLVVAGAFHSPLMQPAADAMAQTLAQTALAAPKIPVWANVSAQPYPLSPAPEQLRASLVQQIVSPVRWSQSCLAILSALGPAATIAFHELAPGTVLRGLMRRIDKSAKVTSHDEPD
jgi:[acyl-carrier-protein] S-malonyltransferase